MKFTAAVMAVLAAVASAEVTLTNSDYDIEAGKPFTIEWTGADGPVTITLKNGDPTDLQTVEVIDSSDSGSSFTWTPPSDLPTDTYAFEIVDSSGVPNYSPQFQFEGTASPSSSAAASSTASETVASTSASETTASATETTASSEASSTSASTSGSSSSSSSSTASSTSSSSASSTSASSSATSTPENTNDSQRLGSPLAFVFVTIAALLYFN